MIIRLAVAIVCACAAGCMFPGPYTDDDPDFSVVGMRVANASDLDFDRVVVHFPNQVEDYGALPAGAVSEYREVEGAYRYAYAVAEAAGRRFLLQPIDYVGERPLPAGRYTYRFSVELTENPEQEGGLQVRLEHDRAGD